MAMNPIVKAKWVAALRSGEYEQVEGALRKNGGFCCLGVLCDLYAKDQGLSWASASFDREGDDLPCDEVCDWAGFPVTSKDDDGNAERCATDIDPEVSIKFSTRGLSGQNDSGRTFAEIAKAIEEQL